MVRDTQIHGPDRAFHGNDMRASLPCLALLAAACAAAPAAAQPYEEYEGGAYVTPPSLTEPSRRAYEPSAIRRFDRERIAAPYAARAPYADDYDGGFGDVYDEYGQATGRVRQGRRSVESAEVEPRVTRSVVAYDGSAAPGTIVVESRERRLYYVTGGGEAISYGVGVGRPGFGWTGVHSVSAKREWPTWTPPEEMRRRRPDLPKFMQGGIENPLGARAMYLGNTLYRIHGSNEPGSIGTAVSSGCIRMTNEDVVDLYQRVKVGTKVIVR
jgi:lipoprotein-anchoring transpeptidase ErfK/SrfK